MQAEWTGLIISLVPLWQCPVPQGKAQSQGRESVEMQGKGSAATVLRTHDMRDQPETVLKLPLDRA